MSRKILRPVKKADMRSAMKVLQGIIDAFGGIRPMGRKLGVSHQIIYDWNTRGVVPARRQQQVSDAADELGIDLSTYRCPECGRFYSDT